MQNNKLIIFSSPFDKTTDKIIFYLLKENIEFHRISKDDIFTNITFTQWTVRGNVTTSVPLLGDLNTHARSSDHYESFNKYFALIFKK